VPADPLLVHDAVLVDVDGRRPDSWALADGGRIVQVGVGDTWRDRAGPSVRVVDAHGSVVTPGFVDLHCHGGAGAAYGPDDPSDALAFHRGHGTTRTLLSLVSAPLATHERWLADAAAVVRDDPLVLGVHLEGPHLARGRCGAHDPDVLGPPTPEDVERRLAAAGGTLAMVTLAPELDGATDATARFVDAGVVVAVGHTDADHGCAAAAFAAGATVLTHAFNAMAPIHHRAPGPVLAAVDAGATIELILDGVHVHPSVASALMRMAPGRVALVTDAVPAAGAPGGTCRLGSLEVEARGDRAVLAGTDTLAGSLLTQDRALALAVEHLGVDLVDAVGALTAVPADALGRPDLGRVREGCRADLVVFDAAWVPTLVVGEGVVLHGRPDAGQRPTPVGR
jgi:N-acetylglucosamine-6-phosphate deacetylase